MKAFVVALLVVLGLTDTKRPVGFVVRVGGTGKVFLKRQNGSTTEVTSDLLKSDVFLLEPDSFVFDGQAFVYYFKDHEWKSERGMPSPGIVGNTPHSNRENSHKAAERVGGRRFGASEIGEVAAKIVAEAGEVNLIHLPANVDFRFAYISPVGASCRNLRLKVDNRVMTYSVNSSMTQSFRRIGVLRCSELTSTLRRLPRGSQFSLAAEFSNRTKYEVNCKLFDGSAADVDSAFGELAKYEYADFEWLGLMNDACSSLESIGLEMQASELIVEWWLHDPENASAKRALSFVISSGDKAQSSK